MNPAQWHKVEKVVEDALQRAPQERAAFIAEACEGDTSLREEVESLLAHDEAADSFLEHPPPVTSAEHEDVSATTSLVGQTVGSYEIIGELGHGGMGTVYLARDAKLGRKVALKLLPEHLTNDEERVRRFRHEARAASALNHPNILTVHEFGRAGQTFFLATEFVDGRTLRDCMATSLNLGAGLEILLGVARALDAAHTAGIVHRDIKPENIMIRPDGYVKVLDFGLAKLTEQAEADSPAMTTFHTRPGFLMGTPNYMSPEQLRGEEVDGRTDIWSLGVVIHEIITNLTPRDSSRVTRPFGLKTRREASLDDGDAAAFADLHLVATKAMARDKEARYQTAQDLIVDLTVIKQSYDFGDATRLLSPEALKAHTRHAATRDGRIVVETGGGAAPTERLHHTRPASSINRLVNKPLAFALLLIIAASFGVLYWRSAPPVERTSTPPANSIQFKRLAVTDQITESVISPDGKYIATVDESAGKQSISVRQVAAPGNKQTIVAPNVRYRGLAFSPDGNHVYFLGSSESKMTLFRVSTLGGTPRKLIEDVHTSVTFSPDGRRLAFVREQANSAVLMIADADGAAEREVATGTEQSVFRTFGDLHNGPAWSPDGKVIVCPTVSKDISLGMNLVQVSAESGVVERLTPEPFYLIGQVKWLSDGSGLIINAEKDAPPSTTFQLWLVGFPSGEVRRITNDYNMYRSVDMTADGNTLITTQVSDVSSLWVVQGFDPPRAAQIESSQNKGTGGVAWLPDGRIIYASDENGNHDIWVMDERGSAVRQLTFDDQMDIKPTTDRSGSYIVFISYRAGAANIWRMNADGTDHKQLTFGDYEDNPQISPDAQWVVYQRESEALKFQIWRVPLEGGEQVRMSDRTAKHPAISPDGRFIACLTQDERPNSPWKVMIIPFAGGAPVKTFDVPPEVGQQWHGIRWSPDGRGITYILNDAGASNIWRQALSSTQPRQLSGFVEDRIEAFAWSPDGRRIACVRRRSVTDIIMMNRFR